MKKRMIIAALAAVVAVWGLAAGGARAANLTTKEILDHVDDLFRGDSSRGNLSMHIITANWERTLTMEWWSQGKEKSLIRILSPQKEKGTGTLRSGNDIWNYLPKTKRTIKLPSSMMSSSWMGSHFTNDDLVKESRMADDFTSEITFEGRRDGASVIDITCLPKPEAAVVWGKVVVTVRAEDYLPLNTAYYDEDLALARNMVFSDVKTLGGRDLPSKMFVLPADKPDEKTEVIYHELIFNVDLPEDKFSLRELQK